MSRTIRSLRIDEVSLVDEPANPEARVLLTKRQAPVKSEDGQEYPAEAYAYVPDPEQPSTWKLRLWESPEAKETAAQVGRAVAALGPGFRGNRVDIPAKDLPGVKRRVVEAWRRTHPDAKEDDMPEVLKARRAPFLTRLGKALGMVPTESPPESPPMTFEDRLASNEAVEQQEEVGEEVWSLIAALQDSLREAIASDLPEEQKRALVSTSLAQFVQAIDQGLGPWMKGETVGKAGRAIAGHRLERLRQALELVRQVVAEADAGGEPENQNGGDGSMPGTMTMDKPRTQTMTQVVPAQATDEDLLKSLPESIRKRLEDAERRAEEAESIAKAEREARVRREFLEKARGYRALPVKAEEFARVLKGLFEKAPEEAKEIESLLQAADEALQKSALFREMGRSGGGAPSAWGQIESLARERLGKGGLTKEQAIAQVLQERPELYRQYREEAN